MPIILLSEAHLWCNASRSKTYEDVRIGILSARNHDGQETVDTVELQRVYGKIKIHRIVPQIPR